jgi:hypothetical protein
MKHTIDLRHLIVINPRLRPVDTVRIGIPTLNQYTLLGKLIINLALNANNEINKSKPKNKNTHLQLILMRL